MEHTENTFSHFAFTQMHIFLTDRCKNLCRFTQICVIYTNLGRREALVDHRHKSQITFTQKKINTYGQPLSHQRVRYLEEDVLGRYLKTSDKGLGNKC